MKLIAIDPWDCGCTECCTGEYVPLRQATDENIADLFAGRLKSNLDTGTRLEVITTYDSYEGRMVVGSDIVTVRYTRWDGYEREWTVDPYRAGFK